MSLMLCFRWTARAKLIVWSPEIGKKESRKLLFIILDNKTLASKTGNVFIPLIDDETLLVCTCNLTYFPTIRFSYNIDVDIPSIANAQPKKVDGYHPLKENPQNLYVGQRRMGKTSLFPQFLNSFPKHKITKQS